MIDIMLLTMMLQVPAPDFGKPLENCFIYREDVLCHAEGVVINISKKEQLKVDKKVSDLKIDIARQTFGAAFDIYFTEYALRNNDNAYEANPLGFNSASRAALKAGSAAAIVLVSDKLRGDGHPTWAKWFSRIGMFFQIGLGVHNYLVGKDGKVQ